MDAFGKSKPSESLFSHQVVGVWVGALSPAPPGVSVGKSPPMVISFAVVDEVVVTTVVDPAVLDTVVAADVVDSSPVDVVEELDPVVLATVVDCSVAMVLVLVTFGFGKLDSGEAGVELSISFPPETVQYWPVPSIL